MSDRETRCRRWVVMPDGTAVPPGAVKRVLKFDSRREAFDVIATSPRICCTTHKLDDACALLRRFGNKHNGWISVAFYASQANLTRTEASHTLSRLVQEGRAYRSGNGQYRWRRKLPHLME